MLRRIALAAMLLVGSVVSAVAQSGCSSIKAGAVLTPAQWNACFAAKNDVLTYTPVNRGGDTMTGRLATSPSTTSAAGFSIPPGSAPASPINGDMWATSSGLFVRVNGSTVGPLVSSSTVALVGNSTPITGTCMSGGILFNNGGTLSCTDTSGSANVTTSGKLSILLPSATVAQALVIGTNSGSSFTPTAGPYNAIEINSTWTTALSGGGGPGGPETMHAMHINLFIGGAAYSAQSVAAFGGVLHHVLDIPTGSGGDLTAIGGFINSTAAAPGRHMYSITGGARCDTGCSAIGILGQENDMFLSGTGAVNYVIGYNSWIEATTTAGRFTTAYAMGTSGATVHPWDKGFTLFTENGGTGQPISTTGDLFYADAAMTMRNVFAFASPDVTVTGSILLFPNVDITGAGTGRFGSATSAGGIEIAGAALDNTALTFAFNSVEKFQIGSTATVAYWTKVGAGTSAISVDFTTNKPSLNNGVTITTAFDAAGLVKNADLVNTTITVNGTTCTLGSTCSPTAAASTITPGTTTVSGATSPCTLVNSSGTVLGCISLTNSYLASGTFSNITGTGTLAAGATGAGFTVALGTSTITGRLALANFTQGSALSVLANATNGTADFASLAAASDSQVLRRSGTALAFGAIDLSASGAVGTSRLAYANLAQGSSRSVLGVTGNATADVASIQSSAAGQILNSTATTIAWTATPVLGVAGTTVGTLGFQNATSGTINVSPPTGALGSVTVFLPAANDTLVGKATTDTLTNKTLTTPTINGGTLSAITSFALRDTSAAFDVTITATSSTALTAGRILTLDLVNAARTLKLGANLTIASDPGTVSGAMKSNGTGTFAQAACADLSNGATGCSTATGTSGATIPLLNGTNTWSGDQTISKANPQLSISKAASGQDTIIAGQTAGVNRWVIDIGNSTAESGNAGSNLGINRYNDAGTFQATPFTIARLDGATTIGEATSAAIVSILSTNTATSKTTGALRVSGGLGVAGATFTDTLNVITMANSATTSAVCYNTATGLLTYNGTVGTCTVSLLAAKNLTAPLGDKEGFDIVMAMEPWRYEMKPDRPTYVAGEQIGFVAEYTKDERVVAHNADGTLAGIRYEQYTAALTAAFKYLKADNDNLRLEVETLKAATGR